MSKNQLRTFIIAKKYVEANGLKFYYRISKLR